MTFNYSKEEADNIIKMLNNRDLLAISILYSRGYDNLPENIYEASNILFRMALGHNNFESVMFFYKKILNDYPFYGKNLALMVPKMKCWMYICIFHNIMFCEDNSE